MARFGSGPRAAVHLVLALPLGYVAALIVWAGLVDPLILGAEPVEKVTHLLGGWALRWLLLTLAISPLARWLRAPGLLGMRRAVGLWAFALGLLHMLTYTLLWAGGIGGLLDDLGKRPYIIAGMLALTLLVPLAATSTRAWQRRLGRRWRRLHQLIYPATACALLHFLWLARSDLAEPLLHAAVFIVLLLARVPARRHGGTTAAG